MKPMRWALVPVAAVALTGAFGSSALAAGAAPAAAAEVAPGPSARGAVLGPKAPTRGSIDASGRAVATVPASDALWAVDIGWETGVSSFGVCLNPMTQASLAGCFASGSETQLPSNSSIQYLVTTDGLNVYFGSPRGLSCPIADYGLNCTPVQVGWETGTPSTQNAPISAAAGDGYIWLGYLNGLIYRCPSDLPYTGASAPPSGCVELDDAGNRAPYQMVYANGTLFVGLSYTGSTKGGGLVWSCPGLVANSCTNLDYLDANGNKVYSLALGAGYLWVGTQNKTLYRCDPVASDSCTSWFTAEEPIPSVAYDGQGTLMTGVSVNQGDGTQLSDSAVLACSTTSASTCSTSMADVYVRQVTADGGEAFSMANQGGSQLPSGPWAWYNASIGSAGFAMTANSQSQLLYIPAGGPTGVGSLRVRPGLAPDRLRAACADGTARRASIRVRGPHGVDITRRIRLCGRGRPVPRPLVTFPLLDPGAYTVTLRTRTFSARARAKVSPRQRTSITLRPRISKGTRP